MRTVLEVVGTAIAVIILWSMLETAGLGGMSVAVVIVAVGWMLRKHTTEPETVKFTAQDYAWLEGSTR